LKTMNEAGAGKIGVVPLFPTVVETLGVLPAIRAGFIECHRMTIQTFQVIGRLLTRKASLRQVSGPVGIAQISGEAARSGIEALIMLMGIISLQLGIFNLLPIPILDGGHLTVIAVESVIRRDRRVLPSHLADGGGALQRHRPHPARKRPPIHLPRVSIEQPSC